MHEEFLRGLRALAEASFPKRCASCGRVYATAEQFLAETAPLRPDRSGLRAGEDDDGRTVIEAFRNCVCGSTLMDLFSDRRDPSPTGSRRRERFSALVEQLAGRGIERETARAELLKVMRGERSELLARLRPPKDE
jgi:hypothetical protein